MAAGSRSKETLENYIKEVEVGPYMKADKTVEGCAIHYSERKAKRLNL